MRTSAETRNQIMAAAEKVMSRKGLKASTVAEIARVAGINESLIYHHFRNKRDLLFSLEGAHMAQVIQRVNEQLAGIPEALSRLSKMVWFHLHYNQSNLDYVLLLLFECRSNIKFYQHPAYGLIQRYAGILLDILRQGVASGAFRQDLDLRLVRDLILGALDWFAVKRITGEDIGEAVGQTQRLMAFIRLLVQARSLPTAQALDKHARILEAAERAFSAKGFASATISDIARLAGVAEGTIYEYFTNKQDLLMSIPKARFAEHIDKLKELFVIKSTPRKLGRFIRHHFLLYLTQPDFLRVFLLNIQLNPHFYGSESYAMYREYTGIVDQILSEGKADGTLWDGLDNEVFKSILFGGFSHVTLRWYISPGKDDQRKMEEINGVVKLLVRTAMHPDLPLAAAEI
ncbi:MAG: TetR/AcrR family transcriptional regulator [Thermodesulfobacteriota bacterium]